MCAMKKKLLLHKTYLHQTSFGYFAFSRDTWQVTLAKAIVDSWQLHLNVSLGMLKLGILIYCVVGMLVCRCQTRSHFIGLPPPHPTHFQNRFYAHARVYWHMYYRISSLDGSFETTVILTPSLEKDPIITRPGRGEAHKYIGRQAAGRRVFRYLWGQAAGHRIFRYMKAAT